MKTRKLGPFEVSAVGLGCMNLSHAYGHPPTPEAGAELLLKALDLGYSHFDTAALYGFGANESLLGRTLKSRRAEFMLASKCGMTGVDGKRVIDGRPETIKRTCEESLSRLQTEVIDLYYLHRWDKAVPIEDSVGALSELVAEGKILTIGLSEVSADTLKKAHAVHPVTALQTEYSLWTRNPEIAVLEACHALGVAFVAFSPVARGYLGGDLRDVSTLPPKDIRLQMPRFQGDAFAANLRLLDGYLPIADEVGCTPGQLALAWLLNRNLDLTPIPGTTRLDHLADNAAAADIVLSPDVMARLEALINARTVTGARYNAPTQAEIDTEG